MSESQPKPHPECRAKHTRYQPTDAEFRCPGCGAKGGDFVIDDESDSAHFDCTVLHTDDYLRCYKCGYGAGGQVFARRVVRQKGLVACPTCKGTGLIRKGVKV